MNEAAIQLIGEINKVLLLEAESLANCEYHRLEGYIARKGQLTLELQRRLNAQVDGVDIALQKAVLELQDNLTRNRKCIQRYITAISDLVQMISAVYAAEASDGIYSRNVVVRSA